jgi:hypothetical protein
MARQGGMKKAARKSGQPKDRRRDVPTSRKGLYHMTREEMEDTIDFLHGKLERERFCENCDDPIISHECAEIWGHMEHWEVMVCEPGEACRRNDEYYAVQDRLDSLISEVEKMDVEEGAA